MKNLMTYPSLRLFSYLSEYPRIYLPAYLSRCSRHPGPLPRRDCIGFSIRHPSKIFLSAFLFVFDRTDKTEPVFDYGFLQLFPVLTFCHIFAVRDLIPSVCSSAGSFLPPLHIRVFEDSRKDGIRQETSYGGRQTRESQRSLVGLSRF